MSLPFLRQTLTRPIPPPSEWDKPWKRLHRLTRIFFFAFVLVAGFLEFLPLFDRTDPNRFTNAVGMELGFPLSYATIGLQSTTFDFVSFVIDILAVGALVIALTCWTERWLRRPQNGRPWYLLHFRTVFLLVALVLCGVIVQVYRSRNENVNREEWPRTHSLRSGIPFRYLRIDSAELYESLSAEMYPSWMISFQPDILVFDILLVGAVIAEATYWFERWQRRPRVLVIEED